MRFKTRHKIRRSQDLTRYDQEQPAIVDHLSVIERS